MSSFDADDNIFSPKTDETPGPDDWSDFDQRGEGALPKTLPAGESAPGKKDGSDAPLKAPPKKKINFDDSDDEKASIEKRDYTSVSQCLTRLGVRSTGSTGEHVLCNLFDFPNIAPKMTTKYEKAKTPIGNLADLKDHFDKRFAEEVADILSASELMRSEAWDSTAGRQLLELGAQACYACSYCTGVYDVHPHERRQASKATPCAFFSRHLPCAASC